MYGHLVSAAYAMREYKLLMARGGMNQAQTMLSTGREHVKPPSVQLAAGCKYAAMCCCCDNAIRHSLHTGRICERGIKFTYRGDSRQ